jgi:hypothetical protein
VPGSENLASPLLGWEDRIMPDQPSDASGRASQAELFSAMQVALENPDILKLLRGERVGGRKQVLQRTREILGRIEAATRKMQGLLDPIRMPDNVFDPTVPDVAAWTVVLALSAQDRVPLKNIVPEYGAGVYALYYRGNHPAYEAVRGTETPIYVGKADPPRTAVADVRTHGVALSNRLVDHRRQIQKAEKYAVEYPDELSAAGLYPLCLADFDCRKLACAPGVQLTAESRLINLFRPLWNSEFGVAYGVSKHGDKQRKHPKSPWDVLHLGREWATGLDDGGRPFPNPPTLRSITANLEEHLRIMPVYRSQADVIEAVLGAFAQTAATADEATAERLAQEAEDSGIIDGDRDV